MNEYADADQRIFSEVIGRFGAPAFMRRAKLVETTWADLIGRGRIERGQQLSMVRLRLGQLFALAGGWEPMRAFIPDEADLGELQRLYAEYPSNLRAPLESTTSLSILQRAAVELVEAMTHFNTRWARWLAKVDLGAVNAAREAYNRFYLLEKECALGSARVARMGFQPLSEATTDDVARHLPLLKLPRIA